MADFNLGTAWIQVAVSGRGIEKGVTSALNNVDYSKSEKNIKSRLGGAFTSVGSVATKALGAVAALGVGTAFAKVAEGAVEASDATDKFRATLEFAGQSKSQIDGLVKSTQAYADATVYSLSDIQSITSQLTSNGIPGAEGLAEAAGNLNAAAGGTSDTFQSVGMVMTQTAGAGKLTTENWNQLADAIPGASGLLQDAMKKNGAYTGNFRDAMADGQITADEFNQAVEQLGSSDSAVKAATSTSTFEGAWGNLQASINKGATAIATAAKPAITGFMSAMSDGASKASTWIIDTLLPGIQRLVPVVQSVFQFVTAHAKTIAEVGLGIATVVMAVKTLITVGQMIKAVTEAWRVAQLLLNVAMSANPIALVVIALVALGTAMVVAYQHSETFRNIVQGAWNGIKVAASAVAGWFTGTALPAMQGVWNGIKGGATSLKNGVASAWNGIKSAVNVVVGWFNTYVKPVIQAVWNGVKSGASFMRNAVVAAWNSVKAGVSIVVGWFNTYVKPVIQAVWNAIIRGVVVLKNGVVAAWNSVKAGVSIVAGWFTGTLKSKMASVADAIKNSFSNMKDGIKKVWDGVKSITAKPVNFVIGTVYTDGIKKLADKMASKLGLKLSLPSVPKIAGYASGGVLPGYSPGKDIYHFTSADGGGALALSGGEAIMRPEWVRAVGGAAAVNAMNRAASLGRRHIPGGDVGNDRAFAKGGIWDAVKGKVTGAVSTASDWMSNAADAVESIIEDPVGAVANLIKKPVDALVDRIPGSGVFVDTVKAMPDKWIDGVANWFKGNASSSSASSSSIVAAARRAVAMHVPYVWGGSSIPPGLDCSGLVYWAAHQMGSKVPRMTAAGYQATAGGAASQNVAGNLLFWGNPAHHVAIASGGGKMVEEPHPGAYAREVPIWGSPSARHYKFDQGGYLQPGYTSVLNATGKPEPVFTSRQFDVMKNGGTLTVNELVFKDADGDLIGRMRAEADARAVTAIKTAFPGQFAR